MESEDQAGASSNWNTFKSWHKDEKFWRDVYARAVSTAILGVLAFFVAALGGYIKVHAATISTIWLFTSLAVLAPFVGEGWNRRAVAWVARHARRNTPKYWMLRVLADAVVIAALAVVPVIGLLVIAAIA